MEKIRATRIQRLRLPVPVNEFSAPMIFCITSRGLKQWAFQHPKPLRGTKNGFSERHAGDGPISHNPHPVPQ